MQLIKSIGNVTWTREDLINKLDDFVDIFKQRPIKNNLGGMKSTHMFYVWFILQYLKPAVIIESGVLNGQGTWLFEKTCPDADLYCIDPDLSHLVYKSKKARYYEDDFSQINWKDLPKDETLLFFDDHQNAYERIKTSYWFGFSNLIFEDNYPANQGDFYTLKHAFMNTGFVKYKRPIKPQDYIKWRLRKTINYMFKMRSALFTDINPNKVDEQYLIDRLAIYYEFPPIFKSKSTKWGDAWEEELYPTSEPLLSSMENHHRQIYMDDINDYNWLCYVKLK